MSGATADRRSCRWYWINKKIQSVRAALAVAQQKPPSEVVVVLLRLPFLLMMLECAAGAALALIFVLTTIVGATMGYSPAITTIFRLFGWARVIGTFDQYGQELVLLTSALCAMSAAVARLFGGGLVDELNENLVRLLSRWGFPVLLALFIFTLGGSWAGLVRVQDFNGESIGGMISFSDANGYTAAAFDALDGKNWNAMALRRPVAAAFRELIVLAGGLSYANALLLQVSLAAFATWAAARAVANWAGAPAGFAFLCLAFAIQRSFLVTMLTEPLGLILSLFSIPFFVISLRFNSLAAACLALGLTTLSLLTRMGAMFLVPALVAWIVIYFGTTLWHKGRILIVCAAIVVAAVSLNHSLSEIHGKAEDLTGSNFAYSLCGLSIGQSWSACPQKYSKELAALPQNEKAQTDFLYAKAISNIRHNPKVFLLRLASGGVEFLSQTPVTVTQGYLRPTPSIVLSPSVFVVVATCGLAIAAWVHWNSREVVFWLLVMASIVASSTFVYFDDGLRVMSASYPLIALFWTRGLQQPATVGEKRPSEKRLYFGGLFIAAAVVVGLLVVPALAPRWINPHDRSRFGITADRHYIYGGRRVSGFVVVADDEQPLKSAPSITLNNFQALIKLSGVEIYQGLAQHDPPSTPFAFIHAARAELGARSDLSYIAPPDVLLDRTVPIWRLTVREWQQKPGLGPYWYFVERAEPVDDQGRAVPAREYPRIPQ